MPCDSVMQVLCLVVCLLRWWRLRMQKMKEKHLSLHGQKQADRSTLVSSVDFGQIRVVYGCIRNWYTWVGRNLENSEKKKLYDELAIDLNVIIIHFQLWCTCLLTKKQLEAGGNSTLTLSVPDCGRWDRSHPVHMSSITPFISWKNLNLREHWSYSAWRD